MSAWPHLPFDEIFVDETGGNIKTPQSEFLPFGGYPIVDQGRELIAGYTNDEARVCKSASPVIVFGDHTRILKFIDFKFALGADGTKVLRTHIKADLKYLYHYLRTVDLPDAGYSRHFKYLRRIAVPLPPLPEQRRIAAILDQADALRAKRREALAKLDEMAQAVFVEMVYGSEVYSASRLDQVCTLITDGTHQTPTYTDDGVIFLSAKNVTSGRIDWKNIKKIPEGLHLELHKRLSPKRGDILLAKNGTTGVSAIVDRDEVFDIYVSLALLRPKVNIDVKFLWLALNSAKCKEQFTGALKGVGVQNLHLVDIRSATIPVPPKQIQRVVVDRIEELEKLQNSAKSSLLYLDRLFASLQHRAFSGTL